MTQNRARFHSQLEDDLLRDVERLQLSAPAEHALEHVPEEYELSDHFDVHGLQFGPKAGYRKKPAGVPKTLWKQVQGHAKAHKAEQAEAATKQAEAAKGAGEQGKKKKDKKKKGGDRGQYVAIEGPRARHMPTG